MKKILAALLSFVLVMSISIAAFGATLNDIDKTLETSAEFVFGDKKSFDVSESKDYFLYLLAGKNDEEIEKAYLDSLKNALVSGEKFDIGTLGIILNIFDKLPSVEPFDFEGYNLLEMFKNTPVADSDNIYNYIYAINAALRYDHFDGNDELHAFSLEICDKLVSKYTIGEGTDFWSGYGTSADDLSVFIITVHHFCCYYALSSKADMVPDTYGKAVDDAIALLKTYNTDAGYDNNGANANSTALALAALNVYADSEAAEDAYNKLMLFYNEETGGFTSSYDDTMATKDAIYALSVYRENFVSPDDNGYACDDSKPANVKSNIKPTIIVVAIILVVAAGGVMVVSKKKKD